MRLPGGAPTGVRSIIGGAILLATACIAASAEPGIAQTSDSTKAPTVHVLGFAQFDYRRATESDTTTSARHEFNVRRARLGVRGTVIPAIRYQLIFQGDGVTANSASVLDMIMDARLLRWLSLRAGQFKYDFDIEAREPDMVTPMTDRSFITNAVAGSLDGTSTASVQLANARDRGIALLLDPKTGTWVWRSRLGLYQGTGRANDNNDQVSVTWQVAVEGGPGILVNGGYLYSDNQPIGVAGIARFNAWTLGARYAAHRLYGRAEYYRANRDLGTSDQDVEGFYVIAGFDPVPLLQLRLRYQSMEDEQFAPGDDQARSTDLGVRWFLDKKTDGGGASLVANVMFRDADAGFSKGLTLLNDGRGAPLDDGSKAGTVGILRMQFEF